MGKVGFPGGWGSTHWECVYLQWRRGIIHRTCPLWFSRLRWLQVSLGVPQAWGDFHRLSCAQQCCRSEKRCPGLVSIFEWRNTAYPVENSITVPQNIENRIAVWSSNSTLGDILKRIQSRILIEISTPMYSAALFIRNSQEMEATQKSIDRWTKCSIYTYGILCNLKKWKKSCHMLQYGWTSKTLC